MDDHAGRRVDRQGVGIRYRVAHLDELHLKAAGLDPVARIDVMKFRDVAGLRVEHLVLYEAAGKPGTIYGNVDARQYERQRAYVVLVSVGDEDTPYF